MNAIHLWHGEIGQQQRDDFCRVRKNRYRVERARACNHLIPNALEHLLADLKHYCVVIHKQHAFTEIRLVNRRRRESAAELLDTRGINDRQDDHKSRAATRRAVHGDMPIHLRDNAMHDAESQPHERSFSGGALPFVVRLSAHIRLEQMLAHDGVDSGAIILHNDFDHALSCSILAHDFNEDSAEVEKCFGLTCRVITRAIIALNRRNRVRGKVHQRLVK